MHIQESCYHWVFMLIAAVVIILWYLFPVIALCYHRQKSKFAFLMLMFCVQKFDSPYEQYSDYYSNHNPIERDLICSIFRTLYFRIDYERGMLVMYRVGYVG
jgi:hypothetical protein